MTAPSGTPGRAILRLALLLLGLLGGGLVLRSFAGHLDTELIDQLVVGQGITGQLVYVLLAAASCATGVPRQAAGFAAGYAFSAALGAPLALVLAMLAQVLGCALDFFWARAVARDWARKRLRGRLARLEAVLADNPFMITLIVRLLPVGNNTAFSLLGGASAARPLPFHAASALGYLPQTVVFVLAGSGAQASGWTQIGLAVAGFAASVVLGLWLYRRYRAMAFN